MAADDGDTPLEPQAWTPPPRPRPNWQGPARPGYAEASAAAHFVAAPLLTAASLSLIGVISADKDNFGWPGVALLLLVLATVFLMGSIQLAFNARKHLYSRQHLIDWYGEEAVEESEVLRTQQSNDRLLWDSKIPRAVNWFNAGTIVLGLGVAATLVPTSESPQYPLRWAAAGLALAGIALECWYIKHIRNESDRPKEADSDDSSSAVASGKE
ncbi:hypothetical protein [Streptomyces sp. NPDC058614]|uniref:hypothetical protein n=1 Tax=Streptomyces sp. NPDC058614 TaxID=3346557 RepID=UPI003660EC97